MLPLSGHELPWLALPQRRDHEHHRHERGRDVDVCFSGRIAATQVLPPRSLSADEIPDRVPTAQ